MKKASGIILLAVYFVFSSGLVVNMHCCMKSMDSIQAGSSSVIPCSREDMHPSGTNKCCGNEVKILKIIDDQQVTGIVFGFSSPHISAGTSAIFDSKLFSGMVTGCTTDNHSPPLNKRDSYLQNCVFRI